MFIPLFNNNGAYSNLTVFFRWIAHYKNVHVALSSYVYSQFSLAHSCCVAAQLNHARLIGLLSLLTFAKGYK